MGVGGEIILLRDVAQDSNVTEVYCACKHCTVYM